MALKWPHITYIAGSILADGRTSFDKKHYTGPIVHQGTRNASRTNHIPCVVCATLFYFSYIFLDCFLFLHHLHSKKSILTSRTSFASSLVAYPTAADPGSSPTGPLHDAPSVALVRHAHYNHSLVENKTDSASNVRISVILASQIVDPQIPVSRETESGAEENATASIAMPWDRNGRTPNKEAR